MTTTDVFELNGSQAVRLPAGFRFNTALVSVRREGDAVVLEPVGAKQWPPGFFDAIRIDDPLLARPEQGRTPSSPRLDR